MKPDDFLLFQIANLKIFEDSFEEGNKKSRQKTLLDNFDVNLFLYPKLLGDTKKEADLKRFQSTIIETDISAMVDQLVKNNLPVKQDIREKSNFANIVTKVINDCIDYRKSIHYRYYSLLYIAITGDSLTKNQFSENIDLELLKKIRVEEKVPFKYKSDFSEKVMKFVPELFLNLKDQDKEDIINADLEILKKQFKLNGIKKALRIKSVIELLDKYTDKNKNKTIYDHYFKKLRKYCINSSTIELIDKPKRILPSQSDDIKNFLERIIEIKKPPFLSNLEFRALKNYLSHSDESIFSNYGKSQIFNRVILKLFIYKEQAVEYFNLSEEEEQALNDNFAGMGMGEDVDSEEYFDDYE